MFDHPNVGPGCADQPGYSHLEAIDPLLWVGNEVAAAHAHFGCVVSTVPSRGLNGRTAPQLTTHAVMFADGQGKETKAGIVHAKSCILQGAAYVSLAAPRVVTSTPCLALPCLTCSVWRVRLMDPRRTR